MMMMTKTLSGLNRIEMTGKEVAIAHHKFFYSRRRQTG